VCYLRSVSSCNVMYDVSINKGRHSSSFSAYFSCNCYPPRSFLCNGSSLKNYDTTQPTHYPGTQTQPVITHNALPPSLCTSKHQYCNTCAPYWSVTQKLYTLFLSPNETLIDYLSIRTNSSLYYVWLWNDRLCGLVVRVPGYRFRGYRGLGSIPSTTRFSEK
jgi:hypothetical protein